MRRHERFIVAAGVLGLLGLWEALARLGRLDASLAPAPSTILEALGRLLRRPEVLQSLGVTAWEALAAFVIAVPVGLLIGFTLAEVPGLGGLLRPLVNFLFGVPKSIFLPVFILVFGVSIPQKIAFGVFTTIFVLIMGGIAAVQSVPHELVTVSRVYGATRLQIIREIYLPAMAPILLESARLGMGFNITAVLLCEIYGAPDGIGYPIAAGGENLQMPQLYAALVLVAVAAVAVNEALRLVETRLGAWRRRSGRAPWSRSAGCRSASARTGPACSPWARSTSTSRMGNLSRWSAPPYAASPPCSRSSRACACPRAARSSATASRSPPRGPARSE